jgi:hypothetical protein
VGVCSSIPITSKPVTVTRTVPSVFTSTVTPPSIGRGYAPGAGEEVGGKAAIPQNEPTTN